MASTEKATPFRCFNSQPPEGGCQIQFEDWHVLTRFNSQPPEGGCATAHDLTILRNLFQLTAARRRLLRRQYSYMFSKKFQLTAARRQLPSSSRIRCAQLMFQLTAARRRLPGPGHRVPPEYRFQLTAARRRLLRPRALLVKQGGVSTHSRPKAAASL